MPNTTPPDIAHALQLKPAEAIKYFESKGLQLTDSWNELMDGQHTSVHTIAHLGKLDILQRVYGALRNALHEGLTADEFERRLTPALQADGWWGKAIDAETGEITQTYPGSSRAVQYGSPARLDLIYRQNLQTAYMVGRYQGLSEGRDSHPYWQYIAIKDSRTRPSHAALNGRVFRREDPAFDSLYPPNGWNCRCRTRPLSDSRLKREGLEVDSSEGKLVDATVPAGRYPDGSPKKADVTGIRTGRYDADGKEIVLFPDAGWSYNPGTSWQMAQRQQLQITLDNLAATLPPPALQRIKTLIMDTLANKDTTPQDILKIHKGNPLDTDLLADTQAIATANRYIQAINPLVYSSIAQGGIKGSAALKHELAEIDALEKMGRNIHHPATVTAIIAEFNLAEAITDRQAKSLWDTIPYHLQALLAELQYIQKRLQQHGIEEKDLGMIASALYHNPDNIEAQNKISTELLAMGLKWHANPSQTLLEALHGR